MISHHVYYQLAILGFLWLCIMLHCGWPSRSTRALSGQPNPGPSRASANTPTHPNPSRGSRNARMALRVNTMPITHTSRLRTRRPDPMPPTHRRPCEIDTSRHFCPHVGCDYRGWLGLGNLRANGHPSGAAPLAPVVLALLYGILSGGARHALAWQTGGGGADRTRARLLGGGPGHSCHGPRGRSEHRPAVAGGSCGAAPGLVRLSRSKRNKRISDVSWRRFIDNH